MTAPSQNSKIEAPFTVIVPAHNEERLIARTLRSMLDRWPGQRKPHVIIACNGCSDGTAKAALMVAPQAEIIELNAASKTGAINAALERTTAFPVIVVDADVQIDPLSLMTLARVLCEPGVMAVSPTSTMQTQNSDWWTRTYYRVWSQQPYLTTGVGGTGVYGLSREGVVQIGQLPLVSGDDTFVRWFFPPSAQRRVDRDGAHLVRSIVEAPLRLKNLIACEARWQAGNMELRKFMAEPVATDASRGAQIAWRSKPEWLVYYAIKILGRAQYLLNRLRGTSGEWHRDFSSRLPNRIVL